MKPQWSRRRTNIFHFKYIRFWGLDKSRISAKPNGQRCHTSSSYDGLHDRTETMHTEQNQTNFLSPMWWMSFSYIPKTRQRTHRDWDPKHRELEQTAFAGFQVTIETRFTLCGYLTTAIIYVCRNNFSFYILLQIKWLHWTGCDVVKDSAFDDLRMWDL